MPMRVEVKNRSSHAHSWRMSFEENRNVAMRYEVNLGVGPREIRQFDLLVPRASLNIQQRSGYQLLSGTIRGYGVENGRFNFPQHYTAYNRSAFVLMSEPLAIVLPKIEKVMQTGAGVEATPYPELVNARFSGAARNVRSLNGSRVVFSDLPPDVRAFSGVTGLWLSPADWAGLDAGHRGAIRRWVIGGGHLFVAAPPEERVSLAGLPPLDSSSQASLGFGVVERAKMDGPELATDDTARAIIALDAAPLPAFQEDFQHAWSLTDFVGWPRLNVLLLITFVLGFAIVIGPANFFFFATERRRHRLFFSVPLCSLAASVALVLVIFASDGVGGIGGRNTVVLLMAGENEATVVQEQVARTRLLLKRTFSLPLDASFALAPSQMRNAETISVERQGSELSGNWFRSRAVQVHGLCNRFPSRAEVLIQRSRDSSTPVPVLLSSVPTPLQNLFYIDSAGNYWFAQELSTGRPARLERSDREAFDSWLQAAATDLSLNLRALLKEIAHRPGYFYAHGDPIEGAPVETLSSIDWNRQTVLFAGTCQSAGRAP